MTLPVDNAWVAVDLDGTILESGHFPALGPPIEGAREGLEEVRAMGLKIMIWTARTSMVDIHGRFQDVNKEIMWIAEHLRSNRIPFDYIHPFAKPTFVYKFIDDRAIQFDGSWSDVLTSVKWDLGKRGIPVFGDKKPYLGRLVL